jgi:hypothetical protein
MRQNSDSQRRCPATGRGATPRTSGPAIVTLRRPAFSYEGDVTIADGLVHFTGRRRLYQGAYRPCDDFAWSVRSISEIRWLEGVQEPAA